MPQKDIVVRNVTGGTGCHFCNVVAGQTIHVADEMVCQSHTHIAMPTIGSIVPGWLLLVPKAHRLNMRVDYGSHAFNRWRIAISREMEDASNARVIMFEHGQLACGSTTGCGVDHAHLHLVPTNVDLVPFIDDLHPEFVWSEMPLSQFSACGVNGEYLLFSSDATATDPICRVTELPYPVSQYFRQVVARAHDSIEHYDYRQFPFENNVLATRRLFSGLESYCDKQDSRVHR